VKRLIVNADDFARSPAIDRGILRAHREGIVTSTTFMANVPGAEQSAVRAREAPSLDIGVHLNITFARPLTDPKRVPSLVQADGSFHPKPTAIVGRGIVMTDDVLREYRAQYARATELLGRAPTHADTHHFVHDDPAIFEALVELARENGLAVRSHTVAQRDRLRAEGIRTPDHFRREFQFDGPLVGGVALAMQPRDLMALLHDPGRQFVDRLFAAVFDAEFFFHLAILPRKP